MRKSEVGTRRIGGRKNMVVCLSNEDGRWCAREKERIEEQDGGTLEKSKAPKQRREPSGTADCRQTQALRLDSALLTPPACFLIIHNLTQRDNVIRQKDDNSFSDHADGSSQERLFPLSRHGKKRRAHNDRKGKHDGQGHLLPPKQHGSMQRDSKDARHAAGPSLPVLCCERAEQSRAENQGLLLSLSKMCVCGGVCVLFAAAVGDPASPSRGSLSCENRDAQARGTTVRPLEVTSSLRKWERSVPNFNTSANCARLRESWDLKSQQEQTVPLSSLSLEPLRSPRIAVSSCQPGRRHQTRYCLPPRSSTTPTHTLLTMSLAKSVYNTVFKRNSV